MDKKSGVRYWLESSEDDWKVANHLFEKEDYSYSLFFGHLTIEKILKAIYVDKIGKLHLIPTGLYIWQKKYPSS